MKLGHEVVRHIALLACLGLSEEEVETLSQQLAHILDNVELLSKVDTTGVPPASHIVPLQSVFRADEVSESYSQADILANAPRLAEKCFKVQAILE